MYFRPLSEKGAFPMCMRSMQNALDATHHIKYNARLQYGLFLKVKSAGNINREFY